METTTVKIRKETRNMLNDFKEYENESLDEVVRKLVFIAKTAKKNPKLSCKTVKDIELARSRIKKGKYFTEDEVKKMLNLK